MSVERGTFIGCDAEDEGVVVVGGEVGGFMEADAEEAEEREVHDLIA